MTKTENEKKLLKIRIFQFILIPVFVLTFFIFIADMFLTMMGGGSGWFWTALLIVEIILEIILEIYRFRIVNKKARKIMIIYNSLIILNVIIFVINPKLFMLSIIFLLAALIMFFISLVFCELEEEKNKTNKKNK